MAGEHFDVTSGDAAKLPQPADAARRFVGIQFNCCDVYTRVYINREKTAYVGHCPKCAKRVRLAIGPGGTDSRFFSVK